MAAKKPMGPPAPSTVIDTRGLVLVAFEWNAKLLIGVQHLTPLLQILQQGHAVKDSDYISEMGEYMYRVEGQLAPEVKILKGVEVAIGATSTQYAAYAEALKADLEMKAGTSHPPLTFDEWLRSTET